MNDLLKIVLGAVVGFLFAMILEWKRKRNSRESTDRSRVLDAITLCSSRLAEYESVMALYINNLEKWVMNGRDREEYDNSLLKDRSSILEAQINSMNTIESFRRTLPNKVFRNLISLAILKFEYAMIAELLIILPQDEHHGRKRQDEIMIELQNVDSKLNRYL